MIHLTIDSDDDLTFEEQEVLESIMSHVYGIIKLMNSTQTDSERGDNDTEQG